LTTEVLTNYNCKHSVVLICVIRNSINMQPFTPVTVLKSHYHLLGKSSHYSLTLLTALNLSRTRQILIYLVTGVTS